MGAICTCENSSGTSNRAFTEAEVAKIIKIQSMVRVRIARNMTRGLKASHSCNTNNIFRKKQYPFLKQNYAARSANFHNIIKISCA